jgi:hypothetical protein
MAGIAWTELSPPERKRTYVFPGGQKLELTDVVRIEVRESGKHRLECADGSRYIVAPEWLYIVLDVDDWTF